MYRNRYANQNKFLTFPIPKIFIGKDKDRKSASGH